MAKKTPLRPASVDDLIEIAEKLAVSDVAQGIPVHDGVVDVVDNQSSKPDISHLADAIWTDETHRVFIPQPGDRVVIERPCTFLSNRPWLDTKVYVVQDINDETGDLKLWDPELLQCALSNFITGPARGLVFKIPDANTRLGERRRGRPRNGAKKITKTTDGVTAPKKRGRPKGSRNRPKDVINAERAAKKAQRAAKKANHVKSRGKRA